MRLLLRLFPCCIAALLCATLAGCAGIDGRGARQAGSIVDFLYPKAQQAPSMQPTVTELRPPVRVGIAFVPGSRLGTGPSEAQKQQLLERVKSAFSNIDYIGRIEVIPSGYLRPGGGFDNLDQVARMFDIEVVALLSYDQIRFHDSSALSVLYWSIVGAYVVHGEKYDVQTLLDAAVFDVKSRKLLFRAPGTSQVKGGASLVGFGEQARAAQEKGYSDAINQLVPRLQAEMNGFRERVKADAGFRIRNKEGYKGGGSLGWIGAVAALILLAAGRARRRAA